MLGEKRQELQNLTLCDKFEPTYLEGQLCYSLDIRRFERKPTKAGKKYGLFFLLDPNPYSMKSSKDKAARNNEESFKVYIHTLAQHSSFGPGVYSMHILKKMSGTESFQQLQDNQKKCQVHNRELCQTNKYFDQVQENCNCVPWSMATENNNEVFHQFNILILCLTSGYQLLWT